jgi:hypothetical protein
MSVPFASTTVSVLRLAPGTEYVEPYNSAAEVRQTVATGVRAHISPVETHSREARAGGEQAVVQYKLDCDIPLSGINHLDLLKDERTNIIYKIRWIAARYSPFEYSHGSLDRVEGLV